jgi:hypothetical protein
MAALRLLPELEDALRQIPGIRAASVVTGPDSRPTEVHVLAQPGKPAKQVVRDVQSVAMAQYDLDIDHRIVSVVQLGEADAPLTVVPPVPLHGQSPAAAEETVELRPALSSIGVRTAEGETEVTVVLTVGGEDYVGVATGPGLAVHRPRVVAQATVAAVSDLLGLAVQVESSQVLEVGLRHVAVTVLSLAVPRLGDQVLCGSVVVRGDESDAVARSVLASLNRRLTG